MWRPQINHESSPNPQIIHNHASVSLYLVAWIGGFDWRFVGGVPFTLYEKMRAKKYQTQEPTKGFSFLSASLQSSAYPNRVPFAPKKRPGRERREHPVQERYHHQQQRGRDDGGHSGVVPIEGVVDRALLDRGGKRSQTQSTLLSAQRSMADQLHKYPGK